MLLESRKFRTAQAASSRSIEPTSSAADEDYRVVEPVSLGVRHLQGQAASSGWPGRVQTTLELDVQPLPRAVYRAGR